MRYRYDGNATAVNAAERVGIAGLRADDRAALLALARERGLPPAPPIGDGVHTGNDVVDGGTIVPLDVHQQRVLDRELQRARATARRLATPAAARRAGYLQAAPFAPGDGVHYIKWSLVVRPFDAANPSMLLYSDVGMHAHLIAFSYYNRNLGGAPGGFSGPNDHWHRHYGLCIVDGATAAENSRAGCRGIWLNGSDLYMLHAWVAESNRWGLFAAINPDECRSIPGCGDIPVPPKTDP